MPLAKRKREIARDQNRRRQNVTEVNALFKQLILAVFFSVRRVSCFYFTSKRNRQVSRELTVRDIDLLITASPPTERPFDSP